MRSASSVQVTSRSAVLRTTVAGSAAVVAGSAAVVVEPAAGAGGPSVSAVTFTVVGLAPAVAPSPAVMANDRALMSPLASVAGTEAS